MTTLNKVNLGKTLQISARIENAIIHDWNNGGLKSTYGLNGLQRKQLLGLLLKGNSPKCECVWCI